MGEPTAANTQHPSAGRLRLVIGRNKVEGNRNTIVNPRRRENSGIFPPTNFPDVSQQTRTDDFADWLEEVPRSRPTR